MASVVAFLSLTAPELVALITPRGYGTAAAVTSSRQLVALGLLLVSGFSLVSVFSILNALVQENAPEALRGRVVSIYGLAFRGGMPLGSLAAGFLVRAVGAPAALGGFAATLLMLGLVLSARPLTLGEAAA